MIVSCAGIDMAPGDLALFIEAKLKAEALQWDPKTSSFEVGLAEGTDVEKIIEAGLEWKGRVFAIEKPYTPQEEFFNLHLIGLPLTNADRLCQSIKESMGKGDKILRITPIYCFGTHLHTGEFTVTVQGKPDAECSRPRHVTIDGREVFVTWRGAPKVCRTCKEEGHFHYQCPTTQHGPADCRQPKILGKGVQQQAAKPTLQLNQSNQSSTSTQLLLPNNSTQQSKSSMPNSSS